MYERVASLARRAGFTGSIRVHMEAEPSPTFGVPVATPPRREMSWRERRAWSYRASGWEAARLHEIQESLDEPLRLLRALESLPAPARYVRAGRRLVGEYTRRMEAAGWQP